jgi:hypothetical protein
LKELSFKLVKLLKADGRADKKPVPSRFSWDENFHCQVPGLFLNFNYASCCLLRNASSLQKENLWIPPLPAHFSQTP